MQHFVNPIFTVLGLVVIFFLTAVSWVLLNAEFLAFALILVYVGALMVLFLFVIMILDQTKNLNTNQNITQKINQNKIKLFKLFKLFLIPLVITIGLTIIFVFIVEDYGLRVPIVINNNNIYLLGYKLFTDYLFQIIIIGLLLLAAIIAVICLKDPNI